MKYKRNLVMALPPPAREQVDRELAKIERAFHSSVTGQQAPTTPGQGVSQADFDAHLADTANPHGTTHSQLPGRGGADQHPIAAITGLAAALAEKVPTTTYEQHVNNAAIHAPLPAPATVAEAVAGTETALRSWSPALIQHAVDSVSVSFDINALPELSARFHDDDRIAVTDSSDNYAPKRAAISRIAEYVIDNSAWHGTAAEITQGTVTQSRMWSPQVLSTAIASASVSFDINALPELSARFHDDDRIAVTDSSDSYTHKRAAISRIAEYVIDNPNWHGTAVEIAQGTITQSRMWSPQVLSAALASVSASFDINALPELSSRFHDDDRIAVTDSSDNYAPKRAAISRIAEYVVDNSAWHGTAAEITQGTITQARMWSPQVLKTSIAAISAGGTVALPATATLAEAAAGTESELRSWSPALISHAIDNLGSPADIDSLPQLNDAFQHDDRMAVSRGGTEYRAAVTRIPEYVLRDSDWYGTSAEVVAGSITEGRTWTPKVLKTAIQSLAVHFDIDALPEIKTKLADTDRMTVSRGGVEHRAAVTRIPEYVLLDPSWHGTAAEVVAGTVTDGRTWTPAVLKAAIEQASPTFDIDALPELSTPFAHTDRMTVSRNGTEHRAAVTRIPEYVLRDSDWYGTAAEVAAGTITEGRTWTPAALKTAIEAQSGDFDIDALPELKTKLADSNRIVVSQFGVEKRAAVTRIPEYVLLDPRWYGTAAEIAAGTIAEGRTWTPAALKSAIQDVAPRFDIDALPELTTSLQHTDRFAVSRNGTEKRAAIPRIAEMLSEDSTYHGTLSQVTAGTATVGKMWTPAVLSAAIQALAPSGGGAPIVAFDPTASSSSLTASPRNLLNTRLTAPESGIILTFVQLSATLNAQGKTGSNLIRGDLTVAGNHRQASTAMMGNNQPIVQYGTAVLIDMLPVSAGTHTAVFKAWVETSSGATAANVVARMFNIFLPGATEA